MSEPYRGHLHPIRWLRAATDTGCHTAFQLHHLTCLPKTYASVLQIASHPQRVQPPPKSRIRPPPNQKLVSSSSMRIWSIDYIKSFGVFSNWRANRIDGNQSHQFGRQTLMFGHNGSGKSTLARLFASMSHPDTRKSNNETLRKVRLTLYDGTEHVRVTADSTQIPPLLVFNRDYVTSNLSKALDAGGQARALYVIGEKDITLERQIVALKTQTELTDAELQEAEEFHTTSSRALKDLNIRVRDDVNDTLEPLIPFKYGTSRFNATHASALAGAGGDHLDSKSEHQAKEELSLKADDLPKEVKKPPEQDTATVRTAVSEAIGLSVTGTVIESLTADPALQDWARHGHALHENRGVCAYCDSEILAPRRAALDAHFSDSYARSEGLIETAQTAIDSARDQLAEMDGYYSAHETGVGAVSTFITARRAELHGLSSSMQSYLEELAERLAERRDDRFSAIAVDLPEEPSTNLLVGLHRAVAEENQARGERQTDLEDNKERAERALLGHIGNHHQDDHTRATIKENSAKAHVERLKSELSALRDKLASAESERSSDDDGHKLAEELTQDLAAYLGRHEITVKYTAIDGVSGFQFLRGQRPATNLSEGEQTAIALLYFLCSLRSKDHSDDLDSTVIVIDDPVTSLDQNALLSAVTFMQSRLGNCNRLRCRQLILMTHNFTFYRLYRRRMQKHLRNGAAPKVDGERPLSPVAALLDIRMLSQHGERTPALRNLNAKMERVASEYGLLFEMACDATKPEGEELVLIAGNVARRLLETFVAFKRPQTEEFANAAEILARDRVREDVMERVVATLNDQSHRRELGLDAERHVSDVIQDIRCALGFISVLDHGHFEGMKEVTGSAPDFDGLSLASAPG